MIGFASFDMMVRGGSVALLCLWSAVLIRDHGKALPARMALCMSAAIICHVISTVPGRVRLETPLDWITILGSTLVPSFFWLFAKVWFNDETQISRRSWGIVFGCSALMSVSILLFTTPGQERSAAILGPIARIPMFTFIFAGLRVAWQGRDGDLIEARRQLRSRLVWAVGIFMVVVLVIEIAVYQGLAPKFMLTLIEAGTLLLTFALCAEMVGLRQEDLFASSISPEKFDRQADPAFLPLAARLKHHMSETRAHRDEALTIAALAAQLGEQEYRLRRVINGHLGYRNFSAFLNGYRLDEVRGALADPQQKTVPILTIALDAGFGSLGPFNRAFREADGMTPTEFRSRRLASSEIS